MTSNPNATGNTAPELTELTAEPEELTSEEAAATKGGAVVFVPRGPLTPSQQTRTDKSSSLPPSQQGLSPSQQT